MNFLAYFLTVFAAIAFLCLLCLGYFLLVLWLLTYSPVAAIVCAILFPSAVLALLVVLDISH